jgi:hypothetical protein
MMAKFIDVNGGTLGLVEDIGTPHVQARLTDHMSGMPSIAVMLRDDGEIDIQLRAGVAVHVRTIKDQCDE